MNLKRIIISIVFILIGASLMSYALSRPCEIGKIKQTIGNVTATVEQPVEMNRMVCLSTDIVALVCLISGTASIFPGIAGLYKGLMDKD